MNETISFASVWLQQLNNPECSMLAGTYIGFVMSWRLIFVLVLFGIVVGGSIKLSSFGLDYIVNKIRLVKK